MAEALILERLSQPETIQAVAPVAKTGIKAIAIIVGVIVLFLFLGIVVVFAAAGKKGKQKTAKQASKSANRPQSTQSQK